MNFTDEINKKISQLVSQIHDAQIYSYIMKELFKQGIFSISSVIKSFNILPDFNKSQIQTNFQKNIYKMKAFIKSIMPNNEIYYVLSCIFGAFLGDAMGAFCEFEKPNPKNCRNIFNNEITVIGGEKGQITDDSEMALSLAYAIMDTPLKEALNVNYIYFYYGAWFNTSPLDFGNTTKNALKIFNFEQFIPNMNNFQAIESKILQDNYESLSNGFLMRKSPFIAWFYYRFYHEINDAFDKFDNNKLFNLYKKIKDLSFEDNRCTNPNDIANIISGIYCLMALMAIKQIPPNIIISKILELCERFSFSNGSNEKQIYEYIQFYIKMFNSPNFDLYTYFGDLKSSDNVFNKMGYYLPAFKLTLYFLYKFDHIEKKNPKRKFREIMNQICNLGGDTDTNCCIVGTVIGPLIGMENFGVEFDKMLNVVPRERQIYSVVMIVLFVIYLKRSNRDNNLIYNDKYFLQQILTMIYGNVDLSY